RSWWCWASGSSATRPRCGADCSVREMGEHTARGSGGGRHELPPGRPAPEIGKLHGGGVAGVVRRGRSQLAFGVLAVLLCLLSGVAIATQVRQTNSDDSL